MARGTLLIVLLPQPARRGDRRPVLLAVAMAALYALISALPLARWFFELEPLPIADAAVLALVAGVWGIAVAALRKLDLPGRIARSRTSSRPPATPEIDRIG